MAIVLEPEGHEVELGVDEDVYPPEHDLAESEPEADIPSFRPVDDRGGPTSYYQGEVGDITQLVVIFENVSNGRPVHEGLDGVDPDDLLIPRKSR